MTRCPCRIDRSDSVASEDEAPAGPRRRPLPQGYRQGAVTAITIFIAFSLAFLRFWGFEAPGDWTARSLAATVALAVPVLMQIYVLHRCLRVADDDEAEYAVTVRWLLASVFAMLVSLVFAGIVVSR